MKVALLDSSVRFIKMNPLASQMYVYVRASRDILGLYTVIDDLVSQVKIS